MENKNLFTQEMKYDEKGNMTYSKDNDGIEKATEYNENGKEIHYKVTRNGKVIRERWMEYDDNGNTIYTKNISMSGKIRETWKEYNSNNKKIHMKESTGYESWTKYDDNGNKIRLDYTNNKGKGWIEYEYNEQNKFVHAIDEHGYEIWQSYEGDKTIRKESNGAEIHWIGKDTLYTKGKSGSELFVEYTEFKKPKSATRKDKDGNIFLTYEFIYDDQNRLIEEKYSDGRNMKKRYEGNIVYINYITKTGESYSEVYEYDDKGNNIFFSTTEDRE